MSYGKAEEPLCLQYKQHNYSYSDSLDTIMQLLAYIFYFIMKAWYDC